MILLQDTELKMYYVVIQSSKNVNIIKIKIVKITFPLNCCFVMDSNDLYKKYIIKKAKSF